MAITRTARGKAQTAAGGAVTLTATSGAFTPAPGSIVVVCVGMDMQVPTAHANVSNETISVSDTFGGSGGGTWTRAASCVKPPPAAAGQYIQHSEIWYRVIGTGPSSGAVTTLCTYGAAETTANDGWYWNDFTELAGVNTAGVVDQTTGNTNRQNAGPTTLTLTFAGTPGATSFVVAHIYADNAPTAPPGTPAGYTVSNSDAPAWGAAHQALYRNGGAAQTLGWTGLASAADHVATAVAFNAATGGTAYALTATGTGTSAGSLAVRGATTLAATGTGSSTGSLAVGIDRKLTATGTGTTAGSLAVTITTGPVAYSVTATGTGTTAGSLAATISTGATSYSLTATGTGTTAGSAAVGIDRKLTATGTGTTGGSLAVRGAGTLAAAGLGVFLGALTLVAVMRMTATGTGQTAGRITMGGGAAVVVVGATSTGTLTTTTSVGSIRTVEVT